MYMINFSLSKNKKKRKFGLFVIPLCIIIISFYLLWGRNAIYKLYYKLNYADEIILHANENELDPSLIAAIIFCESSFRVNAESRVGALGLMQLMPSTAEEIAGKLNIVPWNNAKLMEPDVAIRLGCFYFAEMISSFKTITNSLSAYNAGPGRTREWISKYGTDENGNLVYIPYPETEKYVARVLSAQKVYRRLYPELIADTGI